MIVVEVLGRRGEVTQRVRLERMPATIGRAWSNDVVIGDPTVDPQHARILSDETGRVLIEDLGSLNGLHAGAAKERVPSIALNGVTDVRLGRTALRIARADQPVPPAILDLVPSGRLASLLASPSAMAGVVIAGTLLLLLELWLESYDAKALSSVAGQAVMIVGVVAAWAGIWAMVGRIRVHQFNFWQHSAIAWIALIVLPVLGTVTAYLDFLFATQSVIRGVGSLIEAVIVVALVTTHLGLVSTAPRGRRAGLAAAITGAIVGVSLVSVKAAKNDFRSNTVSIGVALEPLPASMIPASSVDDFLRGTDLLKNQVDRER